MSARLDRGPAAASRARRVVSQALDGWCSDPGLAADAELVASELVTNAVRHGGNPIELRVRRGGERVRVEVADGTGTGPALRAGVDRDAEGGRGLQLVAALAARWGWDRVGTGKVVWAELGA